MAYMSTGILTDAENIFQLKDLLIANGWTWLTALNAVIFSLMHWPCATSCFTIFHETGIKWTLVSFLTPTAFGLALCGIITNIARLFGA